jgi:hypothetical protein
MTIDGATVQLPSADPTAAIRQVLFDAIRNGEGGAPLLKSILADVKLTPEQQAFVDLLLDSDHSQRGAAGAGDDGLEVPDVLADMRQELTDLRQANDTCAAALGACPYCWGGDRHCRVCRGRGRSGYTAPDPELFNELVVPAVQRARALQRAGSRPVSGRERA